MHRGAQEQKSVPEGASGGFSSGVLCVQEAVEAGVARAGRGQGKVGSGRVALWAVVWIWTVAVTDKI